MLQVLNLYVLYDIAHRFAFLNDNAISSILHISKSLKYHK